MSDATSAFPTRDHGDAPFRGGRGNRDGGNRDGGGRDGGGRGSGNREGGNRDGGGFRIRLSDNELRAAQSVQEAFGLRSTVAALGLSIRTVAQLLDEGKLDELVAQQRSQAGSRPPRGEGRERGPRPGQERGERGGSRPNPFARPSRPAVVIDTPGDAATPETDEALAEATLGNTETESVVAESATTETPGAGEASTTTEGTSEASSDAGDSSAA